MRHTARRGPAQTLGAVLSVGLAALVAGACASAPRTAWLSVEVWHGLPEGVAWPDAPGVALLLDATPSMLASAGAGATRLDAARTAAARFLRALPEGTPVATFALGHEGEDACAGVRAVAPASDAPLDVLVRRMIALEPRREGSLAGALEHVARHYRSAPRPPARIVAISDLGGECGGDLCAAARALAGAGVRLELVAIGETPAPACLGEVAPPPGPPPLLAGRERPAPPPFRVVVSPDGEPPGAGGGGAPAGATFSGVADGRAVEVLAGSGRVSLDLDPPLELGPIRLRPAGLTSVRVIDFPSRRPPVRHWVWESFDFSELAGAASRPPQTRAGERTPASSPQSSLRQIPRTPASPPEPGAQRAEGERSQK